MKRPTFPPAVYTFYTSAGIKSDTDAWQWLEDAATRATPPSRLTQAEAEALLDRLQERFPAAVFRLSTPDYSLSRKPR